MTNLNGVAGTTLGHYHVEQLLAKAERADVYRARDERLDRPVAVKVAAHSGAGPAFRAEARLTATLDHPNILPVYDVGDQDGLAYLVMHYAAGGSLEARLRDASRQGGLPLEEVAYYLDQAAAALDYTHTKGIIHCRLKPSNLLLRERWLMLGDFGEARQEGQRGQGASAGASGTSPYTAPEQQQGGPIGPPADLYALGVIVYRMLWGTLPPADFAGRRAGNPAPGAKAPASLAPHLIEAMEGLLRKALAPRPAERFQSAGSLAADLRAILSAPGKKNGLAPDTPETFPVICPSCGFLNKPQARFCRNDGTRLPVLCPRCGAANRSDARFCANDGTELARVCPTCGAVNRRQAQVCQKDQTPLARVCPVCGFENPLRARYCERDGAQLKPIG